MLKPLWDSCRSSDEPGFASMKMENGGSPDFFFANLNPQQMDCARFLAARLAEGVPNTELHAVAGFFGGRSVGSGEVSSLAFKQVHTCRLALHWCARRDTVLSG